MSSDNFKWDKLIGNLLPDLDLTDQDRIRIGRAMIRESFSKVFSTSFNATITLKQRRH